MSPDLAALLERNIAAEAARGRVPQIVLDLDGTLFDNVPRSKVILRDAARHRLGADHPAVGAIDALDEAVFEYNPLDTLRKHGVADEATLAMLREEWADRFFGSAYLAHDVPLDGAVEASRRWWEAGAELNYLTGRHVPEMFPGTCRSLHEAGFPVGTVRTQLLMKPHAELFDVDFKVRTVPSIRRKGGIVLIVDNDPRVLNALVAEVPEALAVMVKTLHPHDAPEPSAGILRIEDFRVFLGTSPASSPNPEATRPMDATPHCLACDRDSAATPLIPLEYRGSRLWICPQHMPSLIHNPAALVGKLPGAETLKPAEHDD